MKRNFVILALALVSLSCAGTQPTQPRIKKPAPPLDSTRVGVATKYCGDQILDENGRLKPAAKFFYEKGEPTGSWSLAGYNMKTEENFNYFLFSFGKKCQLMSGHKYPLKVYSRPPLFDGIGGNIPSGFGRLHQTGNVFISLPDSMDRYDVIIVSDVPLEDVNRESHEFGSIRFETKVTDTADGSKQVVTEADHRVSLEPWTWIASKAANSSDFAIPDHVRVSLKNGTYLVEMKTTSEANQGEVKFALTLPRRLAIRADISNLLFVDPYPPTGDLNTSLSRCGRNDLWPTSNFPSGAIVTAFAEAKVDKTGEYLVEIALSPFEKADTIEVQTKKIFSAVHKIGEEMTLLELKPDFTGIAPGEYWMIASVTQSESQVRAESVALIRVKEAKPEEPEPESTATPSSPLAKEQLLNYNSLLSEFTDSELRAFFKIEDEDFFAQIDTVTNPQFFRAKVTLYLKMKDVDTRRGDSYDRNEWWEEKAEILRWGKFNLKTPIDATLCDARWRWIVTYGIKNFDGLQSQASASRPSGEFGISTYLLRWKSGLEVEFQTLVGGSIPMKFKVVKPGSELVMEDALGRNGEGDRPAPVDYGAILDANRATSEALGEETHSNVFEGIKPLDGWASISFLFAREERENEKGQLLTIVGSGSFPISSFTDSALAGDSLHARIVVYDSNGEFVGKVDEVSWGLKSHLALPKKARDSLIFPIYVKMFLERTYPLDDEGEVELGYLEAGRYRINLSLSADHGRQLGMIEDDFEIPPRTTSLVKVPSGIWGTSDILFTDEPVPEGNLGIMIGGKQYNNNPLSISTGDSLSVLMQIKAPPLTDYLVVVTLHQIDKDEKVFRQISDKTDFSKKHHTVHTEQFRSDEFGYGIFESKVDLSALKSGKAAIQIQVRDPNLDPESEDQPKAISYRRFHKF